MFISVPAFTVILLGIVLYCWFLRTQQRRLTRSVEMLEHLQEQTTPSHIHYNKAA
jgi:preprotein translocase subunit YajC